MHILFITDNFPPEVNAPASRTFEHCREWVRTGHKVTVITCAPNFPRGRVYGGYKNRPYQTHNMDGIHVVRVWSYITANEGFVKRIMDYVSFMASAVIASPLVKKPDLVISTSPQFFSACAAFLISAMKKRPFVFELRDIWPESIKAVGAMDNSSIIRLLEKIEIFLYKKAVRIISVTKSFKQILIKRGVSADKISVVTNGVDLGRFQPRAKDAELVKKYGLENKFIAGYIGTHGMAHALETVLDAADKIRQQDGGDDFYFILLGNGAKKKYLMEKADSMGLDNVVFVDSVPKADVVRYWSLLDVSVIHLRKAKLFTTVIPSKLFECMGMGIPVLHGVMGESADIVLGQQSFTSCASNDTDNDGTSDTPTAQTLSYPYGVWSDGTLLAVIDAGNERVLLWNTFPTSNFQAADLVLGQSDFTHNMANDDDQDGTSDATPSARTFKGASMGINSDGTRFCVTDTYNHRVLVWEAFPTVNFQPADSVYGQENFTNNAYNDDDQNGTPDANASARTFYQPVGCYYQGNNMLFSDFKNNRVLIFSLAP